MARTSRTPWSHFVLSAWLTVPNPNPVIEGWCLIERRWDSGGVALILRSTICIIACLLRFRPSRYRSHPQETTGYQLRTSGEDATRTLKSMVPTSSITNIALQVLLELRSMAWGTRSWYNRREPMSRKPFLRFIYIPLQLRMRGTRKDN